MNHSRTIPLFVVLALSVAAFHAVGEDDRSSPQANTGQNVLVTLTISKTGAGGPREKVYKMVGQDLSDASMMVGWRTPIPTTSTPRDDPKMVPVTAFTYQNVGLNAKLSIKVLDRGRIFLKGGIEISGARESQVGKTDEKAPLIGTFQQALSAIVMEGKKLRIAEGPDPDGGTLALDIEAAVLR